MINILDDIEKSNTIDAFRNAVKWWERQRLAYNTVLVIIELVLMIAFKEGTLAFGVPEAILWSIAYTIAANVFYSVGWGAEVLSLYHFNENYVKRFRNIFFAAGILFSILLTVSLYLNTLHYFKMTALIN